MESGEHRNLANHGIGERLESGLKLRDLGVNAWNVANIGIGEYGIGELIGLGEHGIGEHVELGEHVWNFQVCECGQHGIGQHFMIGEYRYIWQTRNRFALLTFE